MTVITPTDRPKSVSNRCVIKLFDGVFVSPLLFDIFVDIGAVVIGQVRYLPFSLYVTSISFSCSQFKPVLTTKSWCPFYNFIDCYQYRA